MSQTKSTTVRNIRVPCASYFLGKNCAVSKQKNTSLHTSIHTLHASSRQSAALWSIRAATSSKHSIPLIFQTSKSTQIPNSQKNDHSKYPKAHASHTLHGSSRQSFAFRGPCVASRKQPLAQQTFTDLMHRADIVSLFGSPVPFAYKVPKAYLCSSKKVQTRGIHAEIARRIMM